MGKILTLALLLGAAVMFGSATGAADMSDPGMENPADVGVHFDGYGNMGELSIMATPGSQFMVHDATGTPLMGGYMDSQGVQFPIGHAGPGPDGTILWVMVEDVVVAVTDPFWEWD